jgi:hypothetical protein
MNAQTVGINFKVIPNRPHVRHGFGVRDVHEQSVGQNGPARRDLKITVRYRFRAEPQF